MATNFNESPRQVLWPGYNVIKRILDRKYIILTVFAVISVLIVSVQKFAIPSESIEAAAPAVDGDRTIPLACTCILFLDRGIIF